MGEITQEAQEQDRRRSLRQVFNAVVHYHMNGSEFVNVATNISAEGIFIKNFTPPPLGTEIKIRVQLPGDAGARVYLIGRVVRVVDEVGSEDRGMGVEFVSLQADSPKLVQRLVREVFGADDLGEILQPGSPGNYSFLQHPSDTLRLQQGGYRPLPAAVGQYRLLKALLLVLVGMLLGGGLIFMVFLAS
jgi:hypothetical protein